MSVCIINCILHLIPRSVFGGSYIFEETWIILTLSIPAVSIMAPLIFRD